MLNMASHQRNANQNHNEIPPHTSEWVSSKRPQITNVGKNVRKGKPRALLVRM